MTVITAGAATALAAIPGDSTTPVANRLIDLSGYLFAVMTIIMLEKYLLVLTGMLTFKILIPLACASAIIYFISRKQLLKAIAIKLALFGFVIVCVIPASVFVSDIIEDTYQIQSEYSLEEAKKEQQEIQEKSEDKNFLQKITSKVSAELNAVEEKAKNMVSQFTEYIAVMLVVNLAIPILVLFLFIWLLKLFFGINIKMHMPAKKPHELMNRKDAGKISNIDDD